MGTEKLLDKLQKYLKQGEKSKNDVRCEQIDLILGKLEKKEQKLQGRFKHLFKRGVPSKEVDVIQEIANQNIERFNL